MECDADGEVIHSNTKLAFSKLTAIHVQQPFDSVESDVFRLIFLSPNLELVSGICWLSDVARNQSTLLDVFNGIRILPRENNYEVLKRFKGD